MARFNSENKKMEKIELRVKIKNDIPPNYWYSSFKGDIFEVMLAKSGAKKYINEVIGFEDESPDNVFIVVGSDYDGNLILKEHCEEMPYKLKIQDLEFEVNPLACTFSYKVTFDVNSGKILSFKDVTNHAKTRKAEDVNIKCNISNEIWNQLPIIDNIENIIRNIPDDSKRYSVHSKVTRTIHHLNRFIKSHPKVPYSTVVLIIKDWSSRIDKMKLPALIQTHLANFTASYLTIRLSERNE